jgi:hypothetical protein
MLSFRVGQSDSRLKRKSSAKRSLLLFARQLPSMSYRANTVILYVAAKKKKKRVGFLVLVLALVLLYCLAFRRLSVRFNLRRLGGKGQRTRVNCT